MCQSIRNVWVAAGALVVAVTLAAPALAQTVRAEDADLSGAASAPGTRADARKKKDNQRTPYQVRISVSPKGEGFASSILQIPAGKRFVVKHVSAITRVPEGLRVELNFFTYYDNAGDGDTSDDLTFHRFVLTDQGTFAGVAIASANHPMLVFADGPGGTGPSGMVVQARLNGATGAFTQAQVTFSGYLEDLPGVQ